MKRLLFCLLVVMAAVGCDSGSEADTYTVTLSGENGPVYMGSLVLTIEEPGPADEPGEVVGRWQLRGVGGVPDPAPGAGPARGSTSWGQIHIGLDMNAADAGIDLAGTYDDGRISGTWSTITIGGPVPAGTFEAVRE